MESLNAFFSDQFSPDFTLAFCQRGMVILFKWFCAIEQDGHHDAYFKNHILQNQESYETES